MIQLVVAGVSIEKIVADFGVKVGEQTIQKVAIKAAWCAIEAAVPVVVIDNVGIRAGYLLVVRYGTSRTAAALYKVVPILGGLAGGAVDASFTRATGVLAMKAFPRDI
jgi:4-diphosphocytidyl-2C-methyl-D-erythritol kinase